MEGECSATLIDGLTSTTEQVTTFDLNQIADDFTATRIYGTGTHIETNNVGGIQETLTSTDINNNDNL